MNDDFNDHIDDEPTLGGERRDDFFDTPLPADQPDDSLDTPLLADFFDTPPAGDLLATPLLPADQPGDLLATPLLADFFDTPPPVDPPGDLSATPLPYVSFDPPPPVDPPGDLFAAPTPYVSFDPPPRTALFAEGATGDLPGEGTTGDLGRELPRSRRIDDEALDGAPLGVDHSGTEGWETRRMDRYQRLPGEVPDTDGSRRSRAARRREERKTWQRRRLPLALIAALALAVAAIALVVNGGGGEPPKTLGNDDSGGAVVPGGGPAASSPATPTVSPSASPSPAGAPSARVVSGGDVMADRRVKTYAEANGGYAVLSGIAPVLKRGDVTWVNLESPLTTMGSPQPGWDVLFRGTPLLAPALGKAGLDVVTMGNNHAVDYGTAALLDSIERVEKCGVEVVGAGKNDADSWKPAIVRTESGATVGFLAWTDILRTGYVATTGPGVATTRLDVPRMKSAIRKLAKQVDYVVVGYHWGVEYEHYPKASLQIALAHAAIDAGADLVIGHHPNVLQGFEVYRKRLIAYSLGDLVFDHIDIDTGQTVLVDAVLTPTGVTAVLVPVYVSTGGIPAVQKGAAAATILRLVRKYSAPFKTRVTLHGDTATIQAGTR